jgi:hypothetical protein
MDVCFRALRERLLFDHLLARLADGSACTFGTECLSDYWHPETSVCELDPTGVCG